MVDYDFSVPIIGHDGNTAGGSSRILLDFENNIGMVVLTNQLGGSLYRTKMAKIVFGTSDYNVEFDGYYIPARNVFNGRKKIFYNFGLIDACHITSKMVKGMYVNVLSDRLELSATDYIVPSENYKLRDIFTYIWIGTTIYTIILFVICLATIIAHKIKKTKVDKLIIIGTVVSLLNSIIPLYLFFNIPVVVLAIIMLCLVISEIYLMILLIKNTKEMFKSKLSSLYYIGFMATIISIIVVFINSFNWDLFIK